MLAALNTFVITGIEAKPVRVEVDIQNGLPSFEIVGLASTSIKEARERVRAALKNSGFKFPNRKIIVNLAPADLKKEGSHFDLAIALGILIASEQLEYNLSGDYYFCGELSLEGTLRKIPGVLPMVLKLAESGLKDAHLVIPADNNEEAALVPEILSFPVSDFKQVYNFIDGSLKIKPISGTTNCRVFDSQDLHDFADIKGQETAKRALEIAAAGAHNVLLIGPPGAGKTMLARRAPGIFPEMRREEVLETTRIYSAANLLSPEKPLINTRPFRAPHKNASSASIIGGGRIPRPGEISLAQNGILFLDELPEFSRDVLEALRQPLEDKVVTVARAYSAYTFPANFTLIASMNPCGCVTGLPELTFDVGISLNRDLPGNTLGQRIKKTRIEKNLSIEEIAKTVNVSSRTVREWEKDKRKISPRHFKTLCQALEVSPEYVLGSIPENATPGEKIKYHRFCFGHTQREFANLLGVDRSTLSDAENNSRSTQYVLEKIKKLQ